MLPTYATPVDLRADDRVDDALPDATANRVLVEAEDLIDRIAGARRASVNGRRYDVTATGGLSTVQRDGIRDATVAIAAELALNPAALDAPAAQSVSGPDFTLTNVAATSPAMARTVRRVAGNLDRLELRVLSARARA